MTKIKTRRRRWRIAERHGCDAIFMASHVHKGLAAVWHGSQTREVLTHSKLPTLVYR